MKVCVYGTYTGMSSELCAFICMHLHTCTYVNCCICACVNDICTCVNGEVQSNHTKAYTCMYLYDVADTCLDHALTALGHASAESITRSAVRARD